LVKVPLPLWAIHYADLAVIISDIGFQETAAPFADPASHPSRCLFLPSGAGKAKNRNSAHWLSPKLPKKPLLAEAQADFRSRAQHGFERLLRNG
jgi:hypothetical protein